jgi:Ku protein
MGQEAFAVIRDAMDGKDVAALGHIVLSNRQRPIILEPLALGIRGITLRYAHEIRAEAEYFADIPQVQLPPQMVNLAEHIVDKMLADFDPALLEDRYRTTLVSMLREKKAQVPERHASTAPSQKNIVNLMKILRRSLGEARPDKERKSQRAVAAAKSNAGRRTKEITRKSKR